MLARRFRIIFTRQVKNRTYFCQNFCWMPINEVKFVEDLVTGIRWFVSEINLLRLIRLFDYNNQILSYYITLILYIIDFPSLSYLFDWFFGHQYLCFYSNWFYLVTLQQWSGNIISFYLIYSLKNELSRPMQFTHWVVISFYSLNLLNRTCIIN